MKMLYRLTKIKGGRVYQHFESFALTINRKPRKTKPSGKQGDGFLCFSVHDIPYLSAMGLNCIYHPIGYTHLYRVWLDRVREVGVPIVEAECRRLGVDSGGDVVSCFLGASVPDVFSISETEQWLQSVVSVLRRKLPDSSILVKPHPLEDAEHLNCFVGGLGIEHIKITHLHPSLLAGRSRLVIANHTGVILDALAGGTPTILFQDFTPHWLEVHPEGSSYLRLGPLHARTEEKVEEHVEFILTRGFTVAGLEEALKHKKNIDVLLG
jgi:hypothetical protein